MSKANVEMGRNIGIEIEVENTTPNVVRNNPAVADYFSNTHDASIESDATFLSNSGIVSRRNNLTFMRSGNKTIGVEFVSRILDGESEQEVLSALKCITYALEDAGEPDESYRAGIHVHVSMAYNLRVLKSIIRLGRHLEQVFFYLGGMGYKFRGMENGCAYCRPITKWGPAVVRLNDVYWGQCFNIPALLEAKNTDEFWARYCNAANWVDDRYIAVRYHWLNLAAILQKGTLEFRVFNKTLNPFYILAIANFCRSFCNYAFASSYQTIKDDSLIKENSIYDKHSQKGILETLDEFCGIAEVDESTKQTLISIITRTPPIEIAPVFMTTHLRECAAYFSRNNTFQYFPPIVKEAVKPKVVDIHTLRGDR